MKYFRVQEAADMLGLHLIHVYALIRRGELKSQKVGKRGIRLSEEEIRHWLTKQDTNKKHGE